MVQYKEVTYYQQVILITPMRTQSWDDRQKVAYHDHVWGPLPEKQKHPFPGKAGETVLLLLIIYGHLFLPGPVCFSCCDQPCLS